MFVKIIKKHFKQSNKGQSLIELVVVVALAVLITSALVIATILSIRNSSFSKKQIQATKLAQDGLEKLRTDRDQNRENDINYVVNQDFTATKFSDLWDSRVNLNCASFSNCYFYFNSNGVLVSGLRDQFEAVANFSGFNRNFIIEDYINDQGQNLKTCAKTVTAIVTWKDSTGTHESRLSTILRNNSC